MTTTTMPTEENRAATTITNREGIWGEEMTQEGLRQVTFRRPLPVQLITQYAQKAARHAVARQLGDGTWFAEIEGFSGVWSNEPSQKEALDALEEIVFEWVILKIKDQDRDIPVLESLDLNAL
jgi:predicted RNase H-like HicB family nuclease